MSETISRTPTETLIAAMEEAERAKECFVIMTDSNGEILTLASTSIISTRLGLLEMAKACILSDMINKVGGEN